MSKLTLYIDEDGSEGFQIVIAGPEGQVGEPIKLSNEKLLDLNANLAVHVRTAWQRVKTAKLPPANYPTPFKE